MVLRILWLWKNSEDQGAATAIWDELETYVKKIGIQKISVYASITAKPFFEKRGYAVKKEQQVELEGVKLTNYVMEKIH